MEACDKVSPRLWSLGGLDLTATGGRGGKLLVESIWLTETKKNPVFLEFLLSKPSFYHHLPATCPPGIIFGHSDPFANKKYHFFEKIYTQKYGDKREKNFGNRKWGPDFGNFRGKTRKFRKSEKKAFKSLSFFRKIEKTAFSATSPRMRRKTEKSVIFRKK